MKFYVTNPGHTPSTTSGEERAGAATVCRSRTSLALRNNAPLGHYHAWTPERPRRRRGPPPLASGELPHTSQVGLSVTCHDSIFTDLQFGSKKHFYGRGAAEANFI